MDIDELAVMNFETLLLYLEDEYVDFYSTDIEETHAVEVVYVTENSGISYETVLGIVPLEELFHFDATFALEVPKKEVPLLSLGLAIINNKLYFGQFVLDIEELKIGYYQAHYYGSNKVKKDQYDYLINYALFVIDRYLDKIEKFMNHELSISELVTLVNETIN